jgi:hypothetical protein
MKKIITLVAAFAIFLSASNAQNTGDAIVTTTLTDVIVVVVVPVAAIPMATADHYNNGNSTTIPTAVIVTSNQTWDLAVKAANVNFSFLTNNIAINQFTMEVTGNAGGTNTGEVAMSTSDQQLLDEVPGGVALALGAIYGASGGAAFIDIASGAYINTYTFTVTVD